MDEEAIDVEIGLGDDTRAFIGGPQFLGQNRGRFPIRLSATDLAASGWIEFEAWSGGIARLPTFFEDLAANWRGWNGSKDWRDDGGTIAFSATHNGIGLVVLHVSIRKFPGERSGGWQVAAEVTIEPGALGGIADRLRLLIEGVA
jgi:hypothetical protein